MRSLFAHIVVAGKAQPPARDYGRDYKPERGDGYNDIQRYRARGAGTLKNPAHEVEIEQAVKPPVECAYYAQNIGDKVCN